MRKYVVYLATGKTIEVEANVIERATNHCIFYAAKNVVAMFVYENICGWCVKDHCPLTDNPCYEQDCKNCKISKGFEEAVVREVEFRKKMQGVND